MKKYSRENWLDFGLETLREQGYASLKALSLARAMGVTRGSFYHYFESIEVYNESLIEHWTTQSTEVLIDDLKTITNPEAVLLELLKRTLRSGEKLERALRSWSTVDERVASAIALVDARRIAFAKGLLKQIGLKSKEATARAKLLYWAAIGRLMMPDLGANSVSNQEIAGLTKMIIKP